MLPLPLAAQITNTPAVGIAPGGTVPVQTPFFQGVPANATIPRVVPELCVPRPLQTNVDPNLRQIRITFDQPMDTALFFWPLPTNDPFFPTVTANPFWTNGNRTVVLPVVLAPSRSYAIPINTPTLVFRGATGLYANPGLFRFETASQAQGGAVNIGRSPTVPVVRPTVVPVAPPLINKQGTSTGAQSSTSVRSTNVAPRNSRQVQPQQGNNNTVSPRQALQQSRSPRQRPTPTPAAQGKSPL